MPSCDVSVDWDATLATVGGTVGSARTRCGHQPRAKVASERLTGGAATLSFPPSNGRKPSARSSIAQLVEQVTVNLRVVGSSPTRGAISRCKAGHPPRSSPCGAVAFPGDRRWASGDSASG